MGNEQLIEQVETLTKIVEEQQKDLMQLSAKPNTVATVVGILSESVVIEEGGKLSEVEKPAAKLKVKEGSVVRLNAFSQIISLSEAPQNGSTASVSRILDSKTVEVDTPSGKIALSNRSMELSAGDEVILSPGQQIILRKLDKPAKVVISEPITWDHIGGNKQAKSDMIEAIEWPVKMKNLYRKFNKRPMKGVLLYGPPGNGKTMLAKAAASALGELHGKEGLESFFSIKGPEVLSKWVGEGEAQIRRIFSHSRRQAKDNGFPSVLFVDEADSLLTQRGMGIHSAHDTIVNQFLVEMDGIEASDTLVILATNRVDMLDPAVIREGRIDRRVEVPSPTQEDAKEILSIYFKPLPVEKITRENLIECVIDQLFTTVPHRISGALLANVVDRSTTAAIRRAQSDAVIGINKEDVLCAVRGLIG